MDTGGYPCSICSLQPWAYQLASVNLSFLPIKETAFTGLLKLTLRRINEIKNPWKVLGAFREKRLLQTQCIVKEKANLSEGLGKPEHNTTWLKNATQDGALPTKINSVAFPPQHGLLYFLTCQWNDLTACSFSSLFSPTSLIYRENQTVPRMEMFCGTLPAPLSDEAYGAVLIWPRPVYVSQV